MLLTCVFSAANGETRSYSSSSNVMHLVQAPATFAEPPRPAASAAMPAAPVAPPIAAPVAPSVPDQPSSCTTELGDGDSENVAGKPDYAWTDITYLLHQAGVSWRYYVGQGTQPDCDEGQTSCCPLLQKRRSAASTSTSDTAAAASTTRLPKRQSRKARHKRARNSRQDQVMLALSQTGKVATRRGHFIKLQHDAGVLLGKAPDRHRESSAQD